MTDIIRTERLRLTPLTIKSLNRYVQIAKTMRKTKEKNPAYFLYARFDYNAVKTEADLSNAVTDMITNIGDTPHKIIKRFNICLKNGYIIGYIGFFHNSTEKISSDFGIFLAPKYEHKGYALEAQKSLLAYYFSNYDDKLYLTIHPKNQPSYRLNTKCGAQKIAHTDTSKYGSERDILVITRKKFIESVFHKKFANAEKEKLFLLDYLKIYNKI